MASELGVQTIQHPNGTDALTIGTGGITTNSKPIGFSVKLETSQPSIATATYTKIQFQSGGTRTFDTHTGWSNSNYYYTVPSGCGGYWSLGMVFELDVTGTQNFAIISTGTAVGTGANFLARSIFSGDGSTSVNVTPQVYGVVQLNDGDIIKGEVYHNYGSNRSVLANSAFNRSVLYGWRMF